MAVLNCSISPGHLIQQYDVAWHWDSDTSLKIIGSENFVNERFSIDPSTFALRILDVQFSDAGVVYRCGLGVFDRLTNADYIYEPTFFRELSLTVYSELYDQDGVANYFSTKYVYVYRETYR